MADDGRGRWPAARIVYKLLAVAATASLGAAAGVPAGRALGAGVKVGLGSAVWAVVMLMAAVAAWMGFYLLESRVVGWWLGRRAVRRG